MAPPNKGERNPYPVLIDNKFTGWRWRDENGVESDSVYQSEGAALHAMLRHARLPWWQRAWRRFKKWRRGPQ